MTFLPDDAYQRLSRDLLHAAGDESDPESELKQILAGYIAPEAARADIEAHAKVAEGYAKLKTEREDLGREITKWMQKVGVQPDDDDDLAGRLLN